VRKEDGRGLLQKETWKRSKFHAKKKAQNLRVVGASYWKRKGAKRYRRKLPLFGEGKSTRRIRGKIWTIKNLGGNGFQIL